MSVSVNDSYHRMMVSSDASVQPTVNTADIETVVRLLSGSKEASLANYIVPGLTSTLLAETYGGGMVRLFNMEREQEVAIVPHDHRYSFNCFVLAGQVMQRIFSVDLHATENNATHAVVEYDPVAHQVVYGQRRWARAHAIDNAFVKGQWYSMKAHEFHQITFRRGTRVLFIEGPKEQDVSHCLLPFSNGRICDTFMWREWMMEKSL